jgi:hypothetical protein
MKAKTLIILLAVVTLFSCQKKENEPVVTQQEVSFSASMITNPDGLKSTSDVKCKDDLSVDYAAIVIGSNYYFMDVYMLGGKVYTQAIKLDVPPSGSKDFYVTQFYLMRENGGKDPVPPPGGTMVGDDEIIFATPTATSPYKDYVSDPVDIKFTVTAFQKVEIPIDVLCYVESAYGSFGFDWFVITEIVLREACFFGDICLNGNPYFPADYTGSLYSQNGLEEDEVAVFEVRTFKNGNAVPNSPFSNEGTYGNGQPLCVQYPDDLSITGEVFTFEIWVLVKSITAGVFIYQQYATLTCTDNGPLYYLGNALPSNQVIFFAIGNCSPMSDIILAWLAAPPPPTQGGTIDWEAYNDCVHGGSPANATIYSAYMGDGGGFEDPNGYLKNYSTAIDLPVWVEMTGSNISGSTSAAPAAGTDAYNVFDGKVNLGDWSTSYNSSSSPWYYQVVFTGLDPAKTYEFVTTANRNSASYGGAGTGSRWTRFSIIGADTYTNASSAGTVEVTPDVVKMNTGYNTVNGYVVKWTGISAADGSFTIRSENVGGEGPGEANKSYGMEGFYLVQKTP